eukprot:TRINITY_DN24001_c0_g1_i2.p1 TRINITY_DN24001_c0_g1~~TRINITY_DN24001_c0_g1_i2.p1  ORF type:complete len:111 (-),score=15.26 TRINITY_DN24001_c0_g1_i2:92-424(-)
MMLIFHKTWCGACKSLKPRFAEATDIEPLAKEFVMVNLQDDEHPSDPMYSPDGGYIPRIYFTDASGQVRNEIYNSEGNPKYKYYYSSVSQIVDGMKRAKTAFDAGFPATE